MAFNQTEKQEKEYLKQIISFLKKVIGNTDASVKDHVDTLAEYKDYIWSNKDIDPHEIRSMRESILNHFALGESVINKRKRLTKILAIPYFGRIDFLEKKENSKVMPTYIGIHTFYDPESRATLIHTEEECMEWHALYKDREQNTWKFDMIHIRKGSRYDGVVEKVTAAIAERLTPEIRKTILQIKFDVPDGVTIPGIEIYHAVFTGGVRTYKELEEWRKTNQLADSLGWLP